MDFSQVTIQGLPITACRTDDVRSILAETIALPPAICRIATVNLSFLRQADENPAVHDALVACEHRFADGWPILELAQMAKQPLPERVTGASLVPKILSWSRDADWRVGLVGGMEATYDRLRRDHTWSDVICGHWMPYYRDKSNLSDPELCEEIRRAGAQIVLVALGCPKQEFWMHENLEASGAQVGMGIGASLEFLAHVRRRAPRWVQALRMEFVWRFMQEPRRLGNRYLRDYIYWRRTRRAWALETKKMGGVAS